VAVEHRQAGVVKVLLPLGAPMDHPQLAKLMHTVAKRRDFPMAKVLLESAGVEALNTKDSRGRTLLHNAASGASYGIVELLVRQGAEVDARDNNLQTPLHVACASRVRWGRLAARVVRLLVEKGARMDVTDNSDETPRDVALQAENYEAVNLLDRWATEELSTLTPAPGAGACKRMAEDDPAPPAKKAA